MRNGTITVLTKQLPKDLLPDPEPTKEVTFRKSAQDRDCLFLPQKTTRSSSTYRSPSTTSLRKTDNWLAHKPYVQLLVDNESQDMDAKMQSVLCTEHHYSQSLDEYLRQTETVELRRKEMQHKQWTEHVSEPLQKTIANYVDGQSSEDIEKRRRLLLAQYLKYCNRKGRAFLRDYDVSEYNPFILQLGKQYLQVSTPPLLDPLLRQIQERFEEERLSLQCETGRLYSAKEIRELHLQKLPPVPLGRRTMNWNKWVTAPFGYIESEIRQKTRQRMRGTFNQGTMDFKIWAADKYPPELFGTEMQVHQRRRLPRRTSYLPTTSKHWTSGQPTKRITI
ncbi:protein FAM228B [Ascaphus truei]|uniref:protein FAM228B n=1 Tax=Ascaphus truei TaxID=8439 RepID=UPI003F5A0505